MIKQKANKEGRTIYDIPKTARTARVKMYDYEVEILMQLLNYGLIRNVELKDFALEIRSRVTGSSSRGSTSVRLQRLRDANLIKTFQASEATGYLELYRTYFSTYTRKTLDVLFEIGVINNEEFELYLSRLKYIQQNRLTIIPKVHSIATTALGIRLHLELMNYLNPQSFIVSKGVHHHLFSMESQKDFEDEAVYPDILVELPGKQLIAFEVDGWRQLKGVLNAKVSKYEELMKKTMFEGYQLRVVFIPIDSDFIKEEPKDNASARVNYIKNSFPSFLNAKSNVEVFVYRYAHLMEHMKTVMYMEDLLTSKRTSFIAETLITKMQPVLKSKELYVKSFDWKTILPQSDFGEYEPHAAMELGYYAKARKTYYFIYHMITGSVKSQQILNEIYASLKGVMKNTDIEVRILLVYEKQEQRENDALQILEKQAKVYMMATSLEEWEESALTNNKHETLPFYELFSKTNNFITKKENLYL